MKILKQEVFTWLQALQPWACLATEVLLVRCCSCLGKGAHCVYHANCALMALQLKTVSCNLGFLVTMDELNEHSAAHGVGLDRHFVHGNLCGQWMMPI